MCSNLSQGVLQAHSGRGEGSNRTTPQSHSSPHSGQKKGRAGLSMAIILSTDGSCSHLSQCLIPSTSLSLLSQIYPSLSSLFCSISTAVKQGNSGPTFLRLQDPPTQGPRDTSAFNELPSLLTDMSPDRTVLTRAKILHICF